MLYNTVMLLHKNTMKIVINLVIISYLVRSEAALFSFRGQRPSFVSLRGGEKETSVDGSSVESTAVVSQESSISLDALDFPVSKADDGSAEDPDGIPKRYHDAHKARDKAKAAFEHTIEWRKEHEINTILARSHSRYDLCKSIFPVYITGRDKNNHLVIVQRVGLVDFEMAHRNKIMGDDLIMHYVYMVEYCWNIIEPASNAVMTTVLDAKGVDFKTFTDTETRSFLRKFVKVMSDHYPSRSHKTLIINCPRWANLVYNFIKPVLRESTREKIILMNGGKAQDEALIDILGAEAVPSYLLSDDTLLKRNNNTDSSTLLENDTTDASLEGKLRSFVIDILNKNGDEMMVDIEKT